MMLIDWVETWILPQKKKTKEYVLDTSKVTGIEIKHRES